MKPSLLISNFEGFSVLIQSQANIGPPAKRHLNVGMFPGYKEDDNNFLLKATAHVPPVRFKLATRHSQVENSTTEPLCS